MTYSLWTLQRCGASRLNGLPHKRANELRLRLLEADPNAQIVISKESDGTEVYVWPKPTLENARSAA